MKNQDLKKYKLPATPGVYFFCGARKKILYIGKASSLRSRVRSYFRKDVIKSRGEHIVSMVLQAKSVDFVVTDSVLEALILEADLIKKYKPIFNTKEKDDKSFNHVVITKEDFPRVLLMRGKELFETEASKFKYISGPFPQGTVLKSALKIVRKIFPFRDKCKTSFGKPCFNRQIGLCPGVCTGEISKKDYAKVITNIKLFFEGKKSTIIKNLEKEMSMFAKKLEFEKAGNIKKTIFALKHIRDVALLKSYSDNISNRDTFRIEAYDIAHLSGKFAVGVMTVIKDGELSKQEYRKFKIKGFEGVDDTKALAEVLERRLGHQEWQLPRLIVVDGGKAQKNTAERILKKYDIEIPVVGVVKDERHRPRKIIGNKVYAKKYENEILLSNSEAHRFAIRYHRSLRGKIK